MRCHENEFATKQRRSKARWYFIVSAAAVATEIRGFFSFAVSLLKLKSTSALDVDIICGLPGEQVAGCVCGTLLNEAMQCNVIGRLQQGPIRKIRRKVIESERSKEATHRKKNSKKGSES